MILEHNIKYDKLLNIQVNILLSKKFHSNSCSTGRYLLFKILICRYSLVKEAGSSLDQSNGY